MRTAEEIKMWLEGCDDKSKCSRCLNGYQCERDAYTLAYIQQLEAQMPKENAFGLGGCPYMTI